MIITDDDRTDFAAWLADQPSAVQALARQYSPFVCYRDVCHPARHYWIGGYFIIAGEPSLLVLHGVDSTMPGLAEREFPTARLTVCDCGQWEPPTQEQCDRTAQRIAELRAGKLN